MPNILNNLMNAFGQKKQPPQNAAAKPQQQTQNPIEALLGKLTNMENKIDNLTVRNQIMNSQPSLASSNTMSSNQLFEKVMAAANSLKGTPYKWGGEGKGGIDCSAFVRTVMKSAGLNLPRTAREQWHSTKGTLVANDYDPAKMQPGDLIFFKNTTGKTPSGEASHVGIYLGNGKMYHSGGSTNGVGIVDVSKYLRGKWLGVTRPAGNALAMSSMPSMTNAQAFSNNLYTSTSNMSIIQNKNLDFSSPQGVKQDASGKGRYLQNKQAIINAAAKTGVEPGLLAAIAGSESGFQPNASGGKGSTVTGIMQIRPKDWNDGYKWGSKYGVSSTPQPQNNEQALLWVASRFANARDNGTFSKMGISNPTGIDFYMIHFLGEGGYAKFNKNLDKPMASVMPREASWNKEIFYKNGKPRTGHEIKQLMLDKLKKSYVTYGIDLQFSLINGGQTNTAVANNNNSNVPQATNASANKNNNKANNKPKPKTNTVAKKTVPKNNMMADAKKAIQQKTPNKATASASKAKSR